MPKPKHKPPMETWDCLHCGECYWVRQGQEPSDCEICGDALVRRRPDEKPPRSYLFRHDPDTARAGEYQT